MVQVHLISSVGDAERSVALHVPDGCPVAVALAVKTTAGPLAAVGGMIQLASSWPLGSGVWGVIFLTLAPPVSVNNTLPAASTAIPRGAFRYAVTPVPSDVEPYSWPATVAVTTPSPVTARIR